MFLGILFSIIGMIGFALIIYVQNKTWFIVISFASRLVTGFVIIINYIYIEKRDPLCVSRQRFHWQHIYFRID
jgi:predicted tellurium resistance membrane protein TerC